MRIRDRPSVGKTEAAICFQHSRMIQRKGISLRLAAIHRDSKRLAEPANPADPQAIVAIRQGEFRSRHQVNRLADGLVSRLGKHLHGYRDAIIGQLDPSQPPFRIGSPAQPATDDQQDRRRRGVPVLEHVLPSPPPGNQLGLFTMTDRPVLFRDFEVSRRQPTAFVAMQFGEPYDSLYRSAIRPKAHALGFDVTRIDEVNRPGIIFQDIQKKIEDAKVVIAEITAPNQNVFYEVGYAHALNKPTILLAQRGKDLPFDIRSYRVIFYDDSIGGKPLVEKTLREHLDSILQEI
jgi:hypothetical protein